MGCRSRERGEAAVKEIVASSGNDNVEMVELDLLSLASVRRWPAPQFCFFIGNFDFRFAMSVVARPEPLSILINNAGLYFGVSGCLDHLQRNLC